MENFVLESDVVPAMLFVDQVYKSKPDIAITPYIKRKIDELARQPKAGKRLDERAEEVKRLVDDLDQNGNKSSWFSFFRNTYKAPTRLPKYTAIGNYRQILKRSEGAAPEWGEDFSYDCIQGQDRGVCRDNCKVFNCREDAQPRCSKHRCKHDVQQSLNASLAEALERRKVSSWNVMAYLLNLPEGAGNTAESEVAEIIKGTIVI